MDSKLSIFIPKCRPAATNDDGFKSTDTTSGSLFEHSNNDGNQIQFSFNDFKSASLPSPLPFGKAQKRLGFVPLIVERPKVVCPPHTDSTQQSESLLKQSNLARPSFLSHFTTNFDEENLNISKRKKAFQLSTKNILRNICNAQNQYIGFNQEANQIISKRLINPQKFKQWALNLKLHKFQDYRTIWKKNGNYERLYRKLCQKFYTESAIPYILHSRMRDRPTKQAHLKYIYRFLQGLQSPECFSYFTKKAP